MELNLEENEELAILYTFDPCLSARVAQFAHLPGISVIRKTKNKEFRGAKEYTHINIPKEKLLGVLDCFDKLAPDTTYLVFTDKNEHLRARGINGDRIPATFGQEEIKEKNPTFGLQLITNPSRISFHKP